ncbi:DUF2345 domain-containing protein [Klebsiella quasipneumoniae]|uniref:DUF2345 domain-containing protein n=1 Tax=Klebsiella quasipneumoniae TaxID=1463165 RepID=UPI0022047479|nr:DUF2345 domain-containing protein [Klebsiella quasipneumoniae]BDO02418.1 hypothetical protein KAM622c_20050 [Klebsiella quasipneumoniae subsp. quasipneumoniae]
MAAAHSLLAQALSQMESLSQAASAAKAQLLQIAGGEALMEEKLLTVKQAGERDIYYCGQSLASGGHFQTTASENIYMTAGQRIELGANNGICLAASKKISIFTEDEGVETIAAKGDLVSQSGKCTRRCCFSQRWSFSDDCK